MALFTYVTGGYPRVAFYDMLGEQLHNSNLVKHGYTLHFYRGPLGTPGKRKVI